MKIASRTDIAKQVKILELAAQFGIQVESTSAGNFDYRCRCPSVDHKHGKEKTSSCYINSRDNNFFCYGCNQCVSSIDFYMLCASKTFSEAMVEMRSMVKNPGIYQDVIEQKRAAFPILLGTSSIIREYLISNPDQIDNMTGLLKKIDRISFEISKDDPDKIEKMNERLKKMLESK
jgi:DNA primase